MEGKLDVFSRRARNKHKTRINWCQTQSAVLHSWLFVRENADGEALSSSSHAEKIPKREENVSKLETEHSITLQGVGKDFHNFPPPGLNISNYIKKFIKIHTTNKRKI